MQGFKRFLKYLVILLVIIGGLIFWLFHKMEKSAEAALNQSPIVAEYLGKVTVEDMAISIYSPQCEGGCEHHVITLKGEKANAKAAADVMYDGSGISHAVLCLADGTNLALTDDIELIVANRRETLCQ